MAAKFLIVDFASGFVEDFAAGDRCLEKVPMKPFFFNLLSVT